MGDGCKSNISECANDRRRRFPYNGAIMTEPNQSPPAPTEILNLKEIEKLPASAKVVMSGMRPTGKLHLGHYMGVLKNWVTLQDQYPCFFSIADWHALTTKYDDTASLRENILEMALDWLAAGIDPQKATLFVQSSIPEIAELHLLMSMITPAKWVQTDPTLKDMVAMLHEDLSYGLLGYPVLQTVDILSVRAGLVPVGKDQLAHLEISRDIARRFNHLYQADLFAEPRPLLTETPMLIGLDGRKMGKSFNNAIYLSDTADETWSKVKTAITDPARVKRSDPGAPENCEVVYKYYQAFADASAQAVTAEECRAAIRGCMDCKKQLGELINAQMAPLRERRALYAADKGQVEALLKTGGEQARVRCQETLQQVKNLMKLF
ncbi:tryptophan--tRNA ligase [Microcystis phage MaAM05]|nr:tryptophan--tRNA ligase [Microcystis phage MaAM05]